jgi:predicted Zn-dependent protease
MGVLVVGPQNASISGLFRELSRDREATQVREAFARLGSHVAQTQDLGRARAEIADLRARLTDSRRQTERAREAGDMQRRELERRLDELKASRSWVIGNALVRAGRRALGQPHE